MNPFLQNKASRLPAPEEVFVHWLLSVPPNADLEAAARAQITLIDQRGAYHPQLRCLRELLAAVASNSHWRKPLMNQ